MRSTSLLTIALISALHVSALVGFDSFYCRPESKQSIDEGCNGDCNSFEGYRAFRANHTYWAPRGLCVRVYEDAACQCTPDSERGKYPAQFGACVAVTTSAPIRSYTCDDMYFDNCGTRDP